MAITLRIEKATRASYTYLTDDDWTQRITELERIAARCELCPRRCRREPIRTASAVSAARRASSSSRASSPTTARSRRFPAPAARARCFSPTAPSSASSARTTRSPTSRRAGRSRRRNWRRRCSHLQDLGCHNINLVTATHFLPWILRSLKIAADAGLRLPIVYNCGGYELAATVDLLTDVVDIWLPDMKYGDNVPAQRYSAAPDYVEVNQAAIRRMFRQVGPLRCDAEGIADRGLCIRHLVLPNDQSASREVLDFLKHTFDPQDVTISLMAQYRPFYKSEHHPPISGCLAPVEYERIRAAFVEAGFVGFYQEPERLDTSFCIDFKQRKEEPLTGE